MDSPVLVSTFFLTFLLFVGLTFFIRASVKDRTETAQFAWAQSSTVAIEELQTYFAQRSYQPLPTSETAAASTPIADRYTLALAGFVRPSVFMAIFLSLLAAVGLGCLALVLAIALPSFSRWFLVIPALSPLAGWFYWRQAGRIEQVNVMVQPAAIAPTAQAVLTITAHRDEVIALQGAFPIKRQEAEPEPHL